jgi:hypothetical protein
VSRYAVITLVAVLGCRSVPPAIAGGSAAVLENTLSLSERYRSVLRTRQVPRGDRADHDLALMAANDALVAGVNSWIQMHRSE